MSSSGAGIDDDAASGEEDVVVVVGLSKVRSRRAVVVGGGGAVHAGGVGDAAAGGDPLLPHILLLPPLPRHVDHGEWGYYEGGGESSSTSSSTLGGGADVATTTSAAVVVRSGYGKMHYDSGNYYEGHFDNDVYHGTDCTYVWIDGDDERSSWMHGKRHGISVYRSHDEFGWGTVEYRRYENGISVGGGVRWTDGGTVANMTEGVDGGGKEEEEKGGAGEGKGKGGKEGKDGGGIVAMTLEEAGKYAMETFGLAPPDASSFLPPLLLTHPATTSTMRTTTMPDRTFGPTATRTSGNGAWGNETASAYSRRKRTGMSYTRITKWDAPSGRG